MTLADREFVPPGITEIVSYNNLVTPGIAERALHRLHASNPRTSMK